MKIAYFSNYFNHHQRPFADAMNAIPGVEYIFVCTTGIPEFRKKLGYQEMTADYVLDVTSSEENRKKAVELALSADVAIFGGGKAVDYIADRLKLNKLTFNTSERRLKRGLINALSPNFWKHLYIYFRFGRKSPYYMLSCSAYTANDYNLFNAFVERCFKWAYFTKVNNIDIEGILAAKRQETFRIMWCSRFIGWKHPELCLDLAKKLRSDRLDFEINMFGNGPLLDRYIQLVQQESLTDCIHIMGNRKNDEILAAMQEHNAFLFTSDQNEGWGAVANEAMSNGCTLVGSDKIGAVPFLVMDGINGRIFASENADSLYNVVKGLIMDRASCEELSRRAFHDMKNVWSPDNAAKCLMVLIENLQNGEDTSFTEGPCSKAEPYKL